MKPTSLGNEIIFTVFGKPATQGSKVARALYNKAGKPIMKNGRVLTSTRDSNKRLASFRQDVAVSAMAELDKVGVDSFSGPLAMGVVIVRKRPKGHFGTGRNSQILKPSAPEWPTTRPDELKSVRAVEDAMTGVIYADDSQIAHHAIHTVYGDVAKTIVLLRELRTEDDLEVVDRWSRKTAMNR